MSSDSGTFARMHKVLKMPECKDEESHLTSKRSVVDMKKHFVKVNDRFTKL